MRKHGAGAMMDRRVEGRRSWRGRKPITVRCLLVVAGCTLACATHAATSGESPPARMPVITVDDVPVSVAETMKNDASLADVLFVDRTNGWVVGDRGVVWHTADGGQTWQLQSSGVTCPLHSVFFLDRERGWAVGGSALPYSRRSQGVVLWTEDGGTTWNQASRLTLPTMTRVKFFDTEHGIASGAGTPVYPSGVFVTRDGGRNWQPLPAEAPGQWLAGDFIDPDTGAVAGPAGQFATLMRRRVVPSSSAVSSSRALRSLRLVPPTGGWLVGDGGLVMTTHDLGNSWQSPAGELPQHASDHFDFRAVAAAGQHVWLAGSPGTRVLHSADGGQTWESLATGLNTPLRSITFVDEATGWAVGDLGNILATTDGGRTWREQRCGGRRAAILGMFAHAEDAPLELLAKYGGEDGYLAAIDTLHSEEVSAGNCGDGGLDELRNNEAATLAGATATDAAWQFPMPPNDLALSADDLFAKLNRANDGRAIQRIEGHLVRELRTWRPDVVVTHDADTASAEPLAPMIQRLVIGSVAAAADEAQFPELATDVGLSAWQVKKVYGLLPAGSRGDASISASQFAPRLGRALADWAGPARQLLPVTRESSPDSCELRLLSGAAPTTENSRDLFAGIRLAPGSEARRRLANLAEGDIDQMRRLAARRRQMQTLLQRSAGNPAWAGEVANMVDGLDATSGGELLFQLAEQYRAAGKLDLAADTYAMLARRWPDHLLAEPALRWLVQFYASDEMAMRMADRAATGLRPAKTDLAAESVKQASAVVAMDSDSRPTVGLSRDDRLRRAKLLGEYLEKARPSLSAEPSVRFPLVVAERELGFGNPASRYFLTLHQLPASDPWRRCAETEQWFSQPDGSPPPKTLGSCRRTTERPQLDGKLTEAFWQKADRLRLRPTNAGQGTGSTAAESRASKRDAEAAAGEVRFACDGEFLYLAVRCPKATGVEYLPADQPRPRDGDLSQHDRVTVRIDTDRDYTTAFELTADDRGWTRDACWGDATWDPTWYVAAGGDETTWTVEAAIPLAELVSAPPASRQVWAVAIRRTIPKVGYETWAGGSAGEDSPDQFGLLIFE
jgi:photosystem II stability/assembly factor-like uncharacterized protein